MTTPTLKGGDLCPIKVIDIVMDEPPWPCLRREDDIVPGLICRGISTRKECKFALKLVSLRLNILQGSLNSLPCLVD